LAAVVNYNKNVSSTCLITEHWNKSATNN